MIRVERKPREMPRDTATYRFWLRNNAVNWQGVTPIGRLKHPPLIRKISQRGEVYYQET